MDQRELSLAVVGIDYENGDSSSRRFELCLCRPGDRVELRREPANEHDPHAVAVFSERGMQIGYLTAERAPWIGGLIAGGAEVEAVFQGMLPTAAVIRARFGGGSPTLPEPNPGADPDPEFYPDPDGPDWGA